MRSKNSMTGKSTRRSIRQSVTIPATLATEKGVEAEAAARAELTATYKRFIAESDPAKKNEAGKDLIRSIFGSEAIAEDPLL
jgi:hypothetical protein